MLKPRQSRLRQIDKMRLGVLRVRKIAYRKIVLSGNIISVTQHESTVWGPTYSLRADVESKPGRFQANLKMMIDEPEVDAKSKPYGRREV